MSKIAAPVEDTAENHCPACLQGQSLEAGEGTHREGTVEHPVEDTAVELLPCPFCGKQPKSQWYGCSVPGAEDDGYWGIDCCLAYSHADTEEDAAGTWNTRTPPARTRELEKRLAEAEKLLHDLRHRLVEAGMLLSWRNKISVFLSQGSGE